MFCLVFWGLHGEVGPWSCLLHNFHWHAAATLLPTFLYKIFIIHIAVGTVFATAWSCVLLWIVIWAHFHILIWEICFISIILYYFMCNVCMNVYVCVCIFVYMFISFLSLLSLFIFVVVLFVFRKASISCFGGSLCMYIFM